MLDFKDNKPMYSQLIDRISDAILTGKVKSGERILSIRAQAVEMEININTVEKAYDYLRKHDIIYKQRGMGYYVTDIAREKIMEERRQKFFETGVTEFFRQMKMLGIDIKEIDDLWEK